MKNHKLLLQNFLVFILQVTFFNILASYYLDSKKEVIEKKIEIPPSIEDVLLENNRKNFTCNKYDGSINLDDGSLDDVFIHGKHQKYRILFPEKIGNKKINVSISDVNKKHLPLKWEFVNSSHNEINLIGKYENYTVNRSILFENNIITFTDTCKDFFIPCQKAISTQEEYSFFSHSFTGFISANKKKFTQHYKNGNINDSWAGISDNSNLLALLCKNNQNFAIFNEKNLYTVERSGQKCTSSESKFFVGEKNYNELCSINKDYPFIFLCIDFGYIYFFVKPLYLFFYKLINYFDSVFYAMICIYFLPLIIFIPSFYVFMIKSRFFNPQIYLQSIINKDSLKNKIAPPLLPSLLSSLIFMTLTFKILNIIDIVQGYSFLWMQNISLKEHVFIFTYIPVFPLILGCISAIEGVCKNYLHNETLDVKNIFINVIVYIFIAYNMKCYQIMSFTAMKIANLIQYIILYASAKLKNDWI